MTRVWIGLWWLGNQGTTMKVRVCRMGGLASICLVELAYLKHLLTLYLLLILCYRVCTTTK